jgi:transcriptional repressor of dcmA and dcmR
MEQLLNIKEAARILHVTETTIRRWTNTGLLNCYRIGLKRERRFKIDDLAQYLKGVNDDTNRQTAHLGYKGFNVQGGAHMAHLSLDAVESLEMGVAYISEGLRLGEIVLIVAPVKKTALLLAALDEQGINSDVHLRSGRLRASEGMDTPAGQMELITRHAKEASGGFRVFGDMLWTKNKGWSPSDIRELEECACKASIPGANLLLCQYVLSRFSAMTALMAMETHDFAFYQGELAASPYVRKNDRSV